MLFTDNFKNKKHNGTAIEFILKFNGIVNQ